MEVTKMKSSKMVFWFKTDQLKLFSTPIGYSPVLRGLTYIQLGKGNQFHT